MEETYWKQFMTTGRIEDYLQFKAVSCTEEKEQKQSNTHKEMDNAGFSKCNSHCT